MQSICPVCGKPNHCAIKQQKEASSCWCMTMSVPQALLDQIAVEHKGKGCLCQNCLQEMIDKFTEAH